MQPCTTACEFAYEPPKQDTIEIPYEFERKGRAWKECTKTAKQINGSLTIAYSLGIVSVLEPNDNKAIKCPAFDVRNRAQRARCSLGFGHSSRICGSVLSSNRGGQNHSWK